jgi:ribonuclease HI
MHIHVYTDGGIRPMPHLPEGSGLGGVGVTAVFMDDPNALFELATHYDYQVTNQQMEMMAAIEALEFIKHNYIEPQPELAKIDITIYSDSAYLVNCFLQGWWYNWLTKTKWLNSSKEPVANIDLWRRLLSLTVHTYNRCSELGGPKAWNRFNDISDRDMVSNSAMSGMRVNFVKVKGHSGILLNERADELATLGKNGNNIIWYEGCDE